MRVQTRKPCLCILLCAVAGILLSERLACSLPVALLAAFCFAAAAIFGRRILPFWLLIGTSFFIRHEVDWRENPGRLPLDLLAQGITHLRGVGIVTSDPAGAGYAFHTPHSRFLLDVTDIRYDGRDVSTDFSAQVYWTGPPPAWGDEVSLSAGVSAVPGPRNPGEFDMAAYLARKGVFAQLSCNYSDDNLVLAHDKGERFLTWARNCRAALQRRITAGIEDDPETAGLISTITLGAKQETSAATRELFQHVGALHLFVVNGLHVALLSGIMAFLLKPARIYRRAFAGIIIPILFAYALITGLSPGSVRAAIMAAVFFAATFIERKPFSFNTLAAAALILLLWDTNELFQEGFQFSFGVVASIILLADLLQKLILPLGLPDPYLPRVLWSRLQNAQAIAWRWLSGLAAVSVAASLGSFPFSAGYFNLVTPSGFVANLLLVPLAACISIGSHLFSACHLVRLPSAPFQ